MASPSDQGGRAVTPCPKCQAADVKAVALASDFAYLRCCACAFLFVIEDRRSSVRSAHPSHNGRTAVKCPACDGELVRFLLSASELTRAAYFSCDCGHLWSVHKKLAHLIHHVTALPRGRTPRPWSIVKFP